MTIISNVVQPNPSDRSMAPKRPVYGRQGMVLSDNINALIGWKFLRVINSQFIFADKDDDQVGTVKSVWPTQRVRWTLGPLAKYIWVGIWFLAEDGGSTPPQIDARLYDVSGGGAISNTITWTNGSTPGLGVVGNGQFGAIQGDDQFTHTGWNVNDGANTAPGLIDTLGKEGTDVELRLALTECKLYSVSIHEFYRGDIT